ncbi:MAG: iron ABC transporter substrate-binding protein [Chloroflexi bacterium]|nr:iron ABC transporter substrate-binding protein [Chloroflexota bacterium]
MLVAACASPSGGSPGSAPPSGPGSPPPSGAIVTDPSGFLDPVSPAPTGALTIYSGRSEELVGPLIERFRVETGLDVQVKYGSTSEIAATILEEGDASPADVFLAQDAGALGAVAKEGRFVSLPTTALDLVEARFRADDGLWVGVTGRARVAAYDTRVLSVADLPASIFDLTDPKWKGRVGWAPTNGSFQAFVTALRVLRGDADAKAWLEAMQANEPKVYEGNDAIIAAIAAGDVEIGLVNHYYALRQIAEQGESFPVRNHYFAAGDPGALVNVSGVGILATSKNPTAAQAFVEYLLGSEGQTYFAETESEYPLVAGISLGANVKPLDEVGSPEIDLSDLDDLKGTLRLLQDAGVL